MGSEMCIRDSNMTCGREDIIQQEVEEQFPDLHRKSIKGKLIEFTAVAMLSKVR